PRLNGAGARDRKAKVLPAPAKAWWRDAASIPKRETLYDGRYIRRSISATIGGGGRAKTTRAIFEAGRMASRPGPAARDRTGGRPSAQGLAAEWRGGSGRARPARRGGVPALWRDDGRSRRRSLRPIGPGQSVAHRGP